MVLTRAGLAARTLEVSSIHRLPQEVLLHILSFLDGPADLAATSLAGKRMRAVATDPVLMSGWLLKHRAPNSCLALAARKRRGDVMLQLLKMGAPATVRASYHDCGLSTMSLCKPFSPLRSAVEHNLPQVVEYLLKNEAQVRADVEAVIEALHSAAYLGHIECLRLLLTPPSPANANSTLSEFVPTEEGDFLTKLRLESALHLAVQGQKLEAVQMLLSFGASCTYQGAHGRNVLHVACSDLPWWLPDPATAEAGILRAILAVPEGKSVIDSPDSSGDTPLHLAAERGLSRYCEELVRAGSQAINACNTLGRTPYYYSANAKVRKVLLRYGADPTIGGFR